jgi:ubiquinol-cytochrome c reductase cytochrome c subunit
VRSRRRRLGLAGCLLLAACCLLGPAAGEAQAPNGIVHLSGPAHRPLVERGAQLYAGNCLSCHGVDGAGINSPRPNGTGGQTGSGPSLRGVGALAPDFYLRTGRMPLDETGDQPERQRPQFSDGEIRALTAYVASLGKGPPIPRPNPSRGDLATGLQLYTDHCAGCHQVVGEGGYVTGARVPVLKHATPTQIAEAVRIGPYVMPSFSKHDISDRQLDNIIAYVRASRSPDDAGGLGIGHIGPVPEGMVAWLIAAVVLVGVCAVIGERLRA